MTSHRAGATPDRVGADDPARSRPPALQTPAALTPGQPEQPNQHRRSALISLRLLTELAQLGQHTDLRHHTDKPPLTWHVEVRSGTPHQLYGCDPATGALHPVPHPPADWSAAADPPELRHATAVLWVEGTGQARVSAAAHTAWFAAVTRGLDAGVVIGLERDPAGTTRVAALALGDATLVETDAA